MSFNGNAVKREVQLEKGDVEAKNTHSNGHLDIEGILVPLQHKRIRFAGSPSPINTLVPVWPVGDELGVSRPEQNPNCILFHANRTLVQNGVPSFVYETDSNGNSYMKQVATRPQVIIDLEKFSRRVDCSVSSHFMADRPGVIVAAASSSNIGDLSINDDFAAVTVEKLVKTKTRPVTRPAEVGPILLLSVTSTESTTENMVSSTCGRAAREYGILDIAKRTEPYTGGFEHPMVNSSFIPTGHPSYRQHPTPYNLSLRGDDFGRGDGKSTSWVPDVGCEVEIEANGNSLECHKSLENGEVGDEEDLPGEDDDSAGLPVKDETDSAEEGAESEEELTESASESEENDSRRPSKPVITISDQNFPRLVINFGENGVSQNWRVNQQHFKGVYRKSRENNDSIQGSSNIPIQKWVENAQRHNKRKRTDSEVVEERR